MDIHRCRFVEYPPSTINAVAFSISHVSKGHKSAVPRLAIGRANGDIEIWNPLKGAWLQETIIRGGADRSIDGLVWTQDPNEEIQGKLYIGKSRLFSIGYTTTVTEWDLEKGRPLRQVSGSHGEIWCLAAQPPILQNQAVAKDQAVGWQGQNLIAGCMDGALVLYSTKDGGLELQKVLTRPSAKKAKIVSVVFKDRNIVVAGCSDSTIRLYDLRNGQMLRNMTLGAGPKGGPKEIIVWAVKVLKNGNIVSGDSTGELKIWDGKTHTLMQRVKSHTQDILSLATSFDGETIFSGGMDRKTVVYKFNAKGKRWSEIAHRRFHNHDVKAMASFESKGMSVVVSGGPDASPIVVPLKEFGYDHHRTLPFLPQEPIVRSAPKQRLVMSWWDREVHIWKLNRPSKGSRNEQDEDSSAKERKLVAKILIKGEANITAAALSENGNLIAVSTNSDIKVFQLRQRKPEEGEGLKVSKLQVPNAFSHGARLLRFSPDSKWLSIIRPDSNLILARIATSTASASITIHPELSKLSRLDRKIEKLEALGGLGAYNRTITQAAFSADSRILAVSDLAGYIDSFILSGKEDLAQQTPSHDTSSAASSSDSSSESESDEENDDQKQLAKAKLVFGQHWTRNPLASSIPKLPAAPTILSFRSVSTPSQKNLTNGHTPPATRHNPNPISHELPAGEDRLFILTAHLEVFEFEVLKGALSPWSRRNPTLAFSENFRKNKDVAKGAFWDVAAGKERIWVYSLSWMWMFDLSRDLPDAEEGDAENIGANGLPSRKRKRNGVEKGDKGVSLSGAGDAIPDRELLTGISRVVKVTEQGVSKTYHDIAHVDAMDIDDEEDQQQSASALSLLRRANSNKNNAKKAAVDDEDGFVHEWHTYKYRPILGMCIIGSEDGDENHEVAGGQKGKGGKKSVVGMEVVLVERPIWDADLPDRFEGDQEWVKKDYVR